MKTLITIFIIMTLKHPFVSFARDIQKVENIFGKLDLGTLQQVLKLEDFTETYGGKEIMRINISEFLLCEAMFSGFLELSHDKISYLSLYVTDKYLDHNTAEGILNCLHDSAKQKYGEGIFVSKLPYKEDSHKTKQSAYIWQIDDRILLIEMSSYHYSSQSQVAVLNMTLDAIERCGEPEMIEFFNEIFPRIKIPALD